jgi:hypothetical protein
MVFVVLAHVQVAVGLGVTVLALGFVGQLAKQAIEEVEQEEHGGPPPPSQQ